ncbi:hypothetical protein EON65_22060 [archaeon]|nr:MAG: hypothetical protein EON65_22060 [archaeon]
MIWRGKSLREVSRAAQKGELRKAVNIALTRSKGQEGGASDGPGSASLTPKRAAIPSASQKK